MCVTLFVSSGFPPPISPLSLAVFACVLEAEGVSISIACECMCACVCVRVYGLWLRALCKADRGRASTYTTNKAKQR